MEYQRWDDPLEADSENGKLDALAAAAIAESKAGNYRKL